MTNKLLKTLGLAIPLAIAGAGCSRTPLTLKNVGLGGNSYVDKPEVVCAFYDSDNNRTPVINRDPNFDQKKAYDTKGPRIQGQYNVTGYTTPWGNQYATNIQSTTSN